MVYRQAPGFQMNIRPATGSQTSVRHGRRAVLHERDFRARTPGGMLIRYRKTILRTVSTDRQYSSASLSIETSPDASVGSPHCALCRRSRARLLAPLPALAVLREVQRLPGGILLHLFQQIVRQHIGGVSVSHNAPPASPVLLEELPNRVVALDRDSAGLDRADERLLHFARPAVE